MVESGESIDIEAVIEENAQARAELMEAIDGLPAERRREVVHGDWTVSDLVAHITAAQNGYGEALEHVAAGRPARIEGWEPGPPDDWNRAEVLARRARSWEEMLADLDAARERHEAAVRAVPAETYATPQPGFPHGWTRAPNEAEHYATSARHERGHILEILAWREGRGP